MKMTSLIWLMVGFFVIGAGSPVLSAAGGVHELEVKELAAVGAPRALSPYHGGTTVRLSLGEAFINIDLPDDLVTQTFQRAGVRLPGKAGVVVNLDLSEANFEDILNFANEQRAQRQQELNAAFEGVYDVKSKGVEDLIGWLKKAQGMEVHAHFSGLTLEALATITPYAACFRTLHVEGSLLGDKAADFLSFPTFSRVTSLELQKAGLTQVGLKGLLKAPLIRSLTSLSLPSNAIGDEGAALLEVTYRGDPRLSCLTLSNCGLTKTGIESLVQAFGESRTLKTLWLKDNNVGGPGMQSLVKASWPALESLQLGRSNLKNDDVRGVYEARQAGKMPRLNCLFMPKNDDLTGAVHEFISGLRATGIYIPPVY